MYKNLGKFIKNGLSIKHKLNAYNMFNLPQPSLWDIAPDSFLDLDKWWWPYS